MTRSRPVPQIDLVRALAALKRAEHERQTLERGTSEYMAAELNEHELADAVWKIVDGRRRSREI
jgi:hypothetical protein